MEEYEVVVIGAGPGGYAAAIRAADLGKKVAIIERREIGGTCLNRGCIPTKALLRSAEIYEMVKKGTQFGIVNENLSYDLESIHKRKKEVVERLRTGIEFLLKKRGVAIKKGSGKLADRGSVEIDTKTGKETIRGENLIIATGSEP
ncbi:MAG TPA: FAD-dependent oxidoreductase, partial [Thermoplasmata archaeon]|nr:FAD-dependent oxidoreductase [Thermoplasmata archaeon]